MDSSISVQNKNFTRNPEKLAKVPGAREENPVKISPGIIARLHHTDRRLMVLLKEQCAE